MTFTVLVRRWGVFALGLVLIVAAVATVSGQPVSFGWFAYAPLSSGVFAPSPPFLVAMPAGAALAFLLGTGLIAAWAGYRVGRRTPREVDER